MKIQNDSFTEIDLEVCILSFKNYIMCSILVKLQKKVAAIHICLIICYLPSHFYKVWDKNP